MCLKLSMPRAVVRVFWGVGMAAAGAGAMAAPRKVGALMQMEGMEVYPKMCSSEE